MKSVVAILGAVLVAAMISLPQASTVAGRHAQTIRSADSQAVQVVSRYHYRGRTTGFFHRGGSGRCICG
ncbi:MAG: hypothetical protein D6741_04220 [Planctomycetota bacterium]|nr:MAG: hypothetical protein D6741_04220 [Planctomycetota bacterium]